MTGTTVLVNISWNLCNDSVMDTGEKMLNGRQFVEPVQCQHRLRVGHSMQCLSFVFNSRRTYSAFCNRRVSLATNDRPRNILYWIARLIDRHGVGIDGRLTGLRVSLIDTDDATTGAVSINMMPHD